MIILEVVWFVFGFFVFLVFVVVFFFVIGRVVVLVVISLVLLVCKNFEFCKVSRKLLREL